MGWVYRLLIAFVLLLPLIHSGAAYAGANPPAKNPFGVAVPSGGPPTPTSREAPGFFTKIWLLILQTQQSLHRDLAKAVKKIKTDGTLAASISLVLLSFIYGVVHAVGPGHGKAVISSYVLANERTVRRGIILAILASLMQAVTAIAVVGVLAVLLNMSGILIKSTAGYLESASYALVALVGAWLVISLLREQFFTPASAHQHEHHSHDHDHTHTHDHDRDHTHDHGHHHHNHSHGDGACAECGHVHLPDPKLVDESWSLKKAAAIIFAIGIRPCSGALIVLVFALAQGLFWAGIASTFAMSLGTAITVSALAVLAVGSKKLALNFAGGNAIWVDRIYLGLAFFGGSAILILGTMLFIASLGPARPF